MNKIISLSLVCIFVFSCKEEEVNRPPVPDLDFRHEMRTFVQRISTYSKSINPNFLVLPQNGQELLTVDGEPNGALATDFIAAIDGTGREDLFYGYEEDDQATPNEDTEYLIDFLDIAETEGIKVLSTDYCNTASKVDDSYAKNKSKNYISFAADRELNAIPSYPTAIPSSNQNNINSLADAKNFLYLLNPDQFASHDAFVTAIDNTNYDVFILDFFFDDDPLTAADLEKLKTKPNGAKRIVLSYMSIGEAENYRYYWESSWKTGEPEFLDLPNPDYENNYKVHYWNKTWQDIIYGNDASYIKKILDTGFDGVYLDIIDGFEYFEEL